MASALSASAQQVVDGVHVTSPGIIFAGSSTGGAGPKIETLLIKNGGTLSGPDAIFGNSSLNPGDGRTTVDGPGSALSLSNRLVLGLGVNSFGALNITGGGSATDSLGYIGYDTVGAATVAGNHSTWTNSDSLTVGSHGSGSLTVSTGGAVTNVNGTIGGFALSTGSVKVSGSGSTWTNSDSLTVGSQGNGSLTVATGGIVTSVNGTIGDFIHSTGLVQVSDAGSRWDNSGVLTVGGFGGGTLDITGAGRVSGNDVYIAANYGSTGTIAVSDANSNLSAGFLHVGQYGHGVLEISNQGTVTSDGVRMGATSSGDGSAIVRNSGSTWTVNGIGLLVGDQGHGSLEISDRGAVASSAVYIGNSPGSRGDVGVSSTGSMLTGSYISVGYLGQASLVIADGGSVNASVVNLAEGALSTGTVTIDGGTLNTSAITINSGGTLDYHRTGAALGGLTSSTIDNAGHFNLDTVGGVGDTRVVSGALTNQAAGVVSVKIDQGATVTFTDVISNQGAFEVSAKPGVMVADATANFLASFTNALPATFVADPLTTNFTTLTNHGQFTATEGNIVNVSDGLFNDGEFNLTESSLTSSSGLVNEGHFNIFDGATIIGAYTGTGRLTFYVNNPFDSLYFNDLFVGNLDIVFGNGWSSFDSDWSISFAQGATLSGLTIDGIGYQPLDFSGILDRDSDLAPLTATVPDTANTALCLTPLLLLALGRGFTRRPPADSHAATLAGEKVPAAHRLPSR